MAADLALLLNSLLAIKLSNRIPTIKASCNVTAFKNKVICCLFNLIHRHIFIGHTVFKAFKPRLFILILHAGHIHLLEGTMHLVFHQTVVLLF